MATQRQSILASPRGRCGHDRRSRRLRGFTIVDLVVGLLVLAAIVACVVPAAMDARAKPRAVRCASNLRQVCQALLRYASDNRGAFPPNDTSSAPSRFWYDAQRCGQYLRGSASDGGVYGPGVTCPEDDGAQRSYAMNFWASSRIDPATLSLTKGGRPWRSGGKGESLLILATEQWATAGSPQTGWLAQAYVGRRGSTPGSRFGGGGGLSLLWSTRFGALNCELPYARHRRRGERRGVTEAWGPVSIGYVDGHVALKAHDELAGPDGRSTFESLWTPDDRSFDW